MFDGIIRIATKVETKDFDAQIKYLEQKANETEKVLESDLKMPVELRMDERSRLKLRSDLQKTKNQIISLQEQAKKGVDVKPKDASKNFDGMFKSAKRFALSLISIRGAYALLSKASQAYMQTDEATTKQMEANWVGLGTILAPAIDLIVKLFKKAVTSILYFMSVLTGVNYIEKANTAILKKQTEATKELTKANDKLNASFDEMNVLQEPSSSSASGGVDTAPLFDISDIGESARKTIEKIGTALKPLYEKIKDIIKWALDNPQAILGILGGATLLTMLGKIIGIAGVGTTAGTGLSGILGLLLAIASVGVIVVEIKAIYNSVKEAQTTFKETEKMSESLRKSNKELVKSFKENQDAIDFTTESGQNLIDMYFNMAERSLEQADANVAEKDSWGILETAINGMTGATENLTDAYYTNVDSTYAQIQIMSDLYEQGLLNEEQTEQYIEIMKKFKEQVEVTEGPVGDLTDKFWLNEEQLKTLKERYEEVDEKLSDLTEESTNTKAGFGDFTKSLHNAEIQSDETIIKLKDVKGTMEELRKNKDVKMKVSADTEDANNKLKGLFNGFGSKLTTFFGSIGLNIKIPKLATGGIVNNPGNGVFMGSYIAGERGKEGIIPLTDSQAMQQLGQEIGKWISISATVPVYVGNRQIAREIRKIDAEDNFATNR